MTLNNRAKAALSSVIDALTDEGVKPDVEFGPLGHIVASWVFRDSTLMVSIDPEGIVIFAKLYRRIRKG